MLNCLMVFGGRGWGGGGGGVETALQSQMGWQGGTVWSREGMCRVSNLQHCVSPRWAFLYSFSLPTSPQGPHGLAFTWWGLPTPYSPIFCPWESFTYPSFHPSTSPNISAVFWLGLSFLSSPAFHRYFTFVKVILLQLLFFSVVC